MYMFYYNSYLLINVHLPYFTGELTVSGSLDYETTNFYTLTVEGTDKTARKVTSYLNITVSMFTRDPNGCVAHTRWKCHTQSLFLKKAKTSLM